MKKSAILAICVGLIVSVIGVIIKNVILIVLGPVLSLLLFLLSYMEIKRRRRRIFLPDEKYETILSIKQKHSLNKKHILTVFIYLSISVMCFVVIWFLLNNYLYTPSSLSMENIINSGCKELSEGIGKCKKDPSTIIVNFDVNEDGVTGGDGDSLSALLKNQNCVDECIKRRCGCL